MVVKGSKQYRSMVVPYRPWHRLAWVVGLTLLVCGVAVGSFVYGYREAQQDYRQAMEEWSSLHQLASQQAEKLQQLNQQVTNTQVGAEVNLQSIEGLRQEILRLNEQISSLQESNNFYRQLMESQGSSKGLAISSFKVTATSLPRRYRFELVIQQLTVEHKSTTGKVTVMIIGAAGDQPHNYNLRELSDTFPKADIPLKIRFYQTIAGELVLPEGFQPQRVEVNVEKSGGAVVTAHFDWPVKS